MATPSLELIIDAWLADLSIDRASSTAERYATVVRRFLRWFAEHEHRPVEIRDINPITLAGYVQSIKGTEQSNTVNIHVAALRTWGKWLYQYQHLNENPSARLKLIKRQSPTAPRALETAEVNALLREAQRTGRYSVRNSAIIMVLLQTGIRIGECVTLTWGDVSLGEKSGSILIRNGKGGQSRTVPLNASARQGIADYVAPKLNTDATIRAVSQAWSSLDPSEPLWQSERGTMTLSAMERAIKTIIRACAYRGLIAETVTPHSLRHTFAKRYLMAHPGDLVGLARLLGHASLDTTAIYLQPTDAEVQQRVESIDLNAYP